MKNLQIKWWFLKEINEKEIYKDDYILEFWDVRIIDKDKRDIRPYVEDMLRQMNIETWQIKLLKLIIIIIWFLCILTLVLVFSNFLNWWKIKKLNENITNMSSNIEQIKNQKSNNVPVQELPDSFQDTNINTESNSTILRNWFIK